MTLSVAKMTIVGEIWINKWTQRTGEIPLTKILEKKHVLAQLCPTWISHHLGQRLNLCLHGERPEALHDPLFMRWLTLVFLDGSPTKLLKQLPYLLKTKEIQQSRCEMEYSYNLYLPPSSVFKWWSVVEVKVLAVTLKAEAAKFSELSKQT